MKFNDTDPNVSLFSQMESDLGPVVLINKFTVEPTEADALTAAWARDAAFMKTQPGFISTQLHRGIGGSRIFINYAAWESVAAFRNAFAQPEFQAGLARYPSSTIAEPHLLQKVAVPGICLGV